MSSISNLLPVPPDNFSTTLNGSIASNALAIVLNSVTNLGTEGVGVVYKKNSDGTVKTDTVEFVHWTNISGSTLQLTDTGDRGLTGSANGAQAHDSGDTFEVWVYANAHYKGIRTAFLAEHNDAGTHKFTQVLDSNGNETLKLSAVASAVNEVTVANAATGNAVEVSATGGDTNIDLKITPKGTGVIKIPGAITQTGTADHITLTPGSSKLVKVAVLRQNDTTNAYKNSSVILTGWGFIVGNNTAAAGPDAVTFGVTFTEIPIIVISKAGYKNGSDPTTVGDQTGDDTVAAWGMYGSPSTTGFNAYTGRQTGTWNNSDRSIYSWIAIGAI